MLLWRTTMSKKNISDLRNTTRTESEIEERLVRRLNVGCIPDNEILYNLTYIPNTIHICTDHM